jgi:hypothetical protein
MNIFLYFKNIRKKQRGERIYKNAIILLKKIERKHDLSQRGILIDLDFLAFTNDYNFILQLEKDGMLKSFMGSYYDEIITIFKNQELNEQSINVIRNYLIGFTRALKNNLSQIH